MQLAANLSWMYPQLPWGQRFAAARQDGFDAVEILLPYDHPPSWYADQLHAHGLALALFNTPVTPGLGRLGHAALPGAQAEFQRQFDRALAVAQATGCSRIHCMAGDTAAQDAQACRQAMEQNLTHALTLAACDELTLTLEPLNSTDNPGYYYHRPDQVVPLLQHFQSPHLRLQFDYYHCARESLNLLQAVTDAAEWIGHVQIAGAPVRAEPDLGTADWLDAVTALPALGYDSYLSCEYSPRGSVADGLAWCEPLRQRGLLS